MTQVIGGWAGVPNHLNADGIEVKELDGVNHPAHYASHPSGIECIAVTEHMNFCIGNAMKYLWRAEHKGNTIQDLEKAAWYIRREIERLVAKGNDGETD